MEKANARISLSLCVAGTAVLAKEAYEWWVGDPGALDVKSLSGSLLLLFGALSSKVLATGTPQRSGKPVLAVDLDEVCCGYLPAFIKFNNSRHGTTLTPDDFTSYSFWEVAKCKLASRVLDLDHGTSGFSPSALTTSFRPSNPEAVGSSPAIAGEAAIARVYEFHASEYFDDIEPLVGADHCMHAGTRAADASERGLRFMHPSRPPYYTHIEYKSTRILSRWELKPASRCSRSVSNCTWSPRARCRVSLPGPGRLPSACPASLLSSSRGIETRRCRRQADIEAKTRAFVETHFPGLFTGLHFGNHFGRSGVKTSKPDMCARIGAVALIDDSLDYAHQCAQAGIPAFLFGNYAVCWPGLNRMSVCAYTHACIHA